MGPAVASAGNYYGYHGGHHHGVHHHGGHYYSGGYVQVARPAYYVQPVSYAPVTHYRGYAPAYYGGYYARPRYYAPPRYYRAPRYYGGYRGYGYRGGVSVNIGW